MGVSFLITQTKRGFLTLEQKEAKKREEPTKIQIFGSIKMMILMFLLHLTMFV